MMHRKQALLIVAGLAAATALATPAAAQDEPRNASTVVTTARGTASIDRSSVAAEDGRSGTAVITGAEGRTTTRDFDRSYARGEGLTTQSTLTGPNDRSRTAARGASRLAPGEIERSRQVTGARGTARPERRWVRVRRPG